MSLPLIWQEIYKNFKEDPNLGPYLQSPQDYGASSLKFPYITLDLKNTGYTNGLPKGHSKKRLKLTVHVFSKAQNSLESLELMEKIQEVLIGQHVCSNSIELEIRLDQTDMKCEKSHMFPLYQGILDFTIDATE